MFNRNVMLLFSAQLIFVSGTVLIVTLGGIIGNALAPSPTLSTLPMSLMVVGTALGTIPASLFMQRVGRRGGFTLAAAVAIGGCLLGAQALILKSFVLFCIATCLLGTTLAFSQQFRFAAAESVAPAKVSYAVSFILLGSIGGAIIGPFLAANSVQMTPHEPYQGALIAAAAMYALALVLLRGTRFDTAATIESPDHPPRSLLAIATQPLFVCAVCAGVVGQGVMTFVMTATPLSMHIVDGHGLEQTASVIRAHVIAMYLPSLFSGVLIAKFGVSRVLVLGAICMLITLGIGLNGQEVMHYWWALVLLGIGWNFLFVGGTTTLVQTYRPQERFRAQAVNEFSVFGVSALGSLLAGSLIMDWGWQTVLYSAMPPLIAILIVVFWTQRLVTSKPSSLQS